MKKKKKNTPATGSAAGSRKKTTTAGRQITERVLFIAEGLCIGLAVVSHTAAVIHSSTTKPVPSKRGTRVASDSNQGLTDFTSMIKKVQQLQEDVQNTVTTSRVLSRHLEKLGVRFWVTRQSLRDPIQEMAVVTQKTSEVVSALAQHQDVLEIEL
ncbi:unnamed protein product [Sphagnum jensenii]|uniref:Uncharacterized protein n=1 Tax=Sphagnum jensenii TaxID=128206 RepID=A0ABP0WN50_9BRYO